MGRLILAIIISLVLICLSPYPLQANDGEVDLTAKSPGYQVTDLATSSPTRSSIYLTWTTPAAEVCPLSYFDVRYSRTTITTANWDEATSATGEPTPDAGTSQGMRVTGLSSSTRYYFAMKVVDEKGLVGVLSNVVTRTTSAPAAEPGEGYEPAAPPPGTTDVRGKVSTAGVFLRSVTATSEDELCTLTIPTGTVGLTEELEPLDEITILEMDDPPPPPEDAHVVGLAYDFGPDGATFEPAITLTWSYDSADIPEGVAEEDLVIAYYDEEAGEWVELEGCVVDTENKTITAPVEHFTIFVIVVAVPPPPPPAPAAFSVTNLSVRPAEVEPKEAVTITVYVANTGGTEGSYTVVLKINGVKEAEKRTTVAAGRSQTVSFTVSREDAGTYSLVVDGLSGSFIVIKPVPAPPPVIAPVPAPPPVAPPAPPVAPPPPPEIIPPPAPNWPLLGGIIGGAIIVAVLSFFLVRKRRMMKCWGKIKAFFKRRKPEAKGAEKKAAKKKVSPD